MTGYQAPWEQKWAADQAALMQRVATLERQIAQLTSGPVAVLSTAHPATPITGQQILETDTGLTAQWNGTAWVYPPQRLDQKLLTGTAGSITLHVPTGPAFSTLRVAWTARGDNASPATFMCVQFNGDTTATHYLWQNNQAHDATAGPGNGGAATNLIQVGTMAAASAVSGYVGGGAFTVSNASGSTFKAVTAHSTSMNAVNDSYSGTYGGNWLASTQITSILLFPLNGNLVAGSAAYLYGET